MGILTNKKAAASQGLLIAYRQARLNISALPWASLQTKRPLLRKASFSPVFILVNASVHRIPTNEKGNAFTLPFSFAERARLHISALPRASLQTKKAAAAQGLFFARLHPFERKRSPDSDERKKATLSRCLFVCGEGEIRTRGRVTPTTV